MPLRIPRLPLTLVPACIVACFNPSQTSEDGNASADDTSSHDTGDSTGSSPTSSSNPSTTMTTADTDTDGVTTQTTTDPTNGDECGANTECIPAAPEGWAGPFERTTEGTCDGAFPNLHLALGTGVVAPPAACTCSCGTPTGLSCASTLHRRGIGANPNVCLGVLEEATISNAACGGISGFTGDGWQAELPTISGGSCSAMTIPTTEPATFSDEFSLCGIPSPEPCGAGVCLPAMSEMCIVKEGDQECPAGEVFQERHLAFADIMDSRTCTACSCTPTGSCIGWTTRLYAFNCSGASYEFPPDGICRNLGGGNTVNSARLEGGSVSNQGCQPSETTAVGEATGTSIHTVCCAQ